MAAQEASDADTVAYEMRKFHADCWKANQNRSREAANKKPIVDPSRSCYVFFMRAAPPYVVDGNIDRVLIDNELQNFPQMDDLFIAPKVIIVGNSRRIYMWVNNRETFLKLQEHTGWVLRRQFMRKERIDGTWPQCELSKEKPSLKTEILPEQPSDMELEPEDLTLKSMIIEPASSVPQAIHPDLVWQGKSLASLKENLVKADPAKNSAGFSVPSPQNLPAATSISHLTYILVLLLSDL